MENTSKKIRYPFLDELRGFLVLCMVFYHSFYTFGEFFGMKLFSALLDFFTPIEPLFAFLFIFVSGICATLSRSNLIRGAKLMAVAVVFNLITIFLLPVFNIEGAQIYFGVLNLLAFAMLLIGLIEKPLIKINAILGTLISVGLFLFFYNISLGYLGFRPLNIDLPAALYKENLFILGLPSIQFYSADYFPILPWLFAFFAGFYFGVWQKSRGFFSIFRRSIIPPLAFLGKNALVVYIIHQPIIFGVAYIIELTK